VLVFAAVFPAQQQHVFAAVSVAVADEPFALAGWADLQHDLAAAQHDCPFWQQSALAPAQHGRLAWQHASFAAQQSTGFCSVPAPVKRSPTPRIEPVISLINMDISSSDSEW
jgi:hypothetical protein